MVSTILSFRYPKYIVLHGEILNLRKYTPILEPYSAPALAKTNCGVKNVTTDTIFRIGSVTKLFTIYTFLVQASDGHWHDPVTNYIPELQSAAKTLNATQNPIDHVAWEDVTLLELASHMAGIGRDYSGLQELDGVIFPASNPSALGLPPLNASEIVLCGGGSFCTRSQFFTEFTNRHPVFAPSTTPIYSNAALQMLAYAFENITGIDMETMINTSLIKSLNLTSTSWTLPPLVPDFGVGVTVLTAGPGATPNSRILGGLVTDVVMQAVEDVGRKEAGMLFERKYEAGEKVLNSSISIEVDETKLGLGVVSWVRNGTDMLSAQGVAAPSVRLYPSGLKRDIGGGETEMGFRAVFEDLDAPVIGGDFGTKCETWLGVDGNYWGAFAVNEFLFLIGKDGKARSVVPRALRVELVRS